MKSKTHTKRKVQRLLPEAPCSAFVMKPGHKKWRRFCNRLAGPEACDFKDHPTKRFTFKCGGGNDRSMATRILKDMGADVKASLAFFSEHGGHCDCEILFNVDR
jgi:hypothetical protein